MVSFVDKFADLYAKTLGEQPPPIEKLKEVNEQLSQKYVPKNAAKYPTYADQPDTYQADLMFELYINSKKEKILQAILVVINVNTKYAFAETVDYEKNYKGMEEKSLERQLFKNTTEQQRRTTRLTFVQTHSREYEKRSRGIERIRGIQEQSTLQNQKTIHR